MKGDGRKVGITSDMVQEAMRLRQEDPRRWSYRALGQRFGCSFKHMHALVSGGDAARQQERRKEEKEAAAGRRGSGIKPGPRPLTEEQLRERRRAIPPDTRNRWQCHFDEPPPGRSALDQKRQGASV